MFDASVVEVFIASTADLVDARDAVERVLRDWNSRNAKERQIILKSLRWEKDATPQLDQQGGQDVINTQLLEDADLLVGIFGKRLGSPTKTNVSGTVEEITRFRDAKKPVLLYFSDESALSNSDPAELQRVKDFRSSMAVESLYQTFSSTTNLEQLFRSHLDSVLQDFKALLIPASKALAYGYFKGFLERVYEFVRGDQILLPDLALALHLESSRIRIAQPASLSEATDEAARNLKDRCGEVSILSLAGGRRAFRVYVPKSFAKRLQAAKKRNKKEMAIKSLDVVDFPTPLIALHDFVAQVEQRLLGKSSEGLGYWKKAQELQYVQFFSQLDDCIKDSGLGRGNRTIERFDYHNSPDFELPE